MHAARGPPRLEALGGGHAGARGQALAVPRRRGGRGRGRAARLALLVTAAQLDRAVLRLRSVHRLITSDAAQRGSVQVQARLPNAARPAPASNKLHRPWAERCRHRPRGARLGCGGARAVARARARLPRGRRRAAPRGRWVPVGVAAGGAQHGAGPVVRVRGAPVERAWPHARRRAARIRAQLGHAHARRVSQQAARLRRLRA